MSKPKPKPSRTKKTVVSRYMAKLGAKGGKTTGKSKARSSETMRKIAQETWAKKKAKKLEENGSGDGGEPAKE